MRCLTNQVIFAAMELVVMDDVDIDSGEHFTSYPSEHCKRERRKARELRLSPWWRRLLDQGICYYCGHKFSFENITMDHKVPLIRGGVSSKNNIVPCCKTCNNEKAHQLSIDWSLNYEESKSNKSNHSK